jgi:hypothetical protein
MGQVWTRDNWNNIIQQVNDLAQNPPEGTDCDPLDTLEEVDSEHIWTKGNVEEVRDKLGEICDENIFSEALKYWEQAVIDEINAAITNGWCGCEEECLLDCSNAVAPGTNPIETYIGSWTVEDCHANPLPWEWPERELALQAGYDTVLALSDWSDLWVEYCALVDAVEELEHELEVLQNQLSALEAIRDDECAKPLPNNCAAAQADVDEKQADVDAKQVELDAKEDERDAKKEEADNKEDEAEARAAQSAAYAGTAPDCMHQFIDDVNSEPIADTDCVFLGPECIGRDPLRCGVSWVIQRKTHQYWKSGEEYHGGWQIMMSGGYTRYGQPYVTYIFFPCISQYACSSMGPDPCHVYPWTWDSGCITYQVEEVRLLQSFPVTTPEGEVCCD